MALIGVHTTNGGEKMADFVKEQGVPYPVAIDRDGATVKAFAVDSFPDYYLIDRAGKLRFADLANGELERALALLLAEEAPEGASAAAVHPALAAAAKTATLKDKRVLVAWDGAPTTALTSGDRALATLLRNEYEVVALKSAEHPELAASTEARGATLAALDTSGRLLGARSAEGLDAAAFGAFLEAHRVPQKDAEALWRDARAQAQRENKRLLVHLGAPW